MDKKVKLLVHLIFVTSSYTKIKVHKMPRVRQPCEAELTHSDWLLKSPGKETKIRTMMCTKTSTDDYENLCKLDLLGVIDIVRDDLAVYQDFKDRLRRSKALVRNWIDVKR